MIPSTEQMARMLGSIPLSADILTKARIGLWAFELDEGRPPRMYADAAMRALIGLDRPVSPEETYHAWYDRIDPDYYGLVTESVDKMVAGEHAEVQYPWHHPGGETWIVRCGGVRNFKYTKGVRIEGIHQNVTELLHYDSRDLDNANKLIQNVADTYDLVYTVNLADDSFRLLKATPGFIRSDENFDTFSQVKAHFFSLLPPEEGERMALELCYDNIRRNLTGQNAYSVEYYLPVENTATFHEMAVTKIDEDLVAIGFLEQNSEVIRHRLEKKRYDEYFSLAEIDLDTGMFRALKAGGYGQDGAVHPYTSFMERMAQASGGSAKAFFSRIADLDYLRKDLATEDRRYSTYYMRMNGKEVWVDSTLYVLQRHKDGSPAILSMGFSFSDSQSIEKQRSQQLLQDALSAAQSASRAKTSFLSSMSHDIRTPMNAIMGFTALAEKHIDNPEQALSYLQKIDRSSEHLLSLINEVLDMSRIESGKLTLDNRPESLPELTANLQDLVLAEIRKKQQTFTLDLSGITHGNVLCDKLRLNQILLNLLSNAVKYTGEGGEISLTVSEAPAAAPGYGAYTFRVKDNGKGISPEYLPKLFEPFSREKSTTVSGIQGTGLGMPIAKSLVDMMGGTISVDSTLGAGTEFTVTVELRCADCGFAEQAKAPEPDVPKAAGKKLLLVEDNPMNREIATELLEDCGFTVASAEDGDIAVRMVTGAGPGDYDLVLMDVQMPTLNGYEATKQIRASGAPLAGIPIIAMTANAFEEDRKAAFDAGMNEHIAKPFNIKKMLSVLEKFL